MSWIDTGAGQATRRKRVLNTGSGPADNQRLHAAFEPGTWESVRLDIDIAVRPDLIGQIQDMRSIVPDRSFDAVWSSHSLEHLHSHDVLPAMREFRRILRSDGFAMITCPDLEIVAALLLERGLDDPIYQSPAGPISCIDMIFGHRASVAAGSVYMAHNTGFTTDTLGALALEAGFEEVHVGRGTAYDLWAVALMPEARQHDVAAMLKNTSEAYLLPR